MPNPRSECFLDQGGTGILECKFVPEGQSALGIGSKKSWWEVFDVILISLGHFSLHIFLILLTCHFTFRAHLWWDLSENSFRTFSIDLCDYVQNLKLSMQFDFSSVEKTISGLVLCQHSNASRCAEQGLVMGCCHWWHTPFVRLIDRGQGTEMEFRTPPFLPPFAPLKLIESKVHPAPPTFCIIHNWQHINYSRNCLHLAPPASVV